MLALIIYIIISYGTTEDDSVIINKIKNESNSAVLFIKQDMISEDCLSDKKSYTDLMDDPSSKCNLITERFEFDL